MAEYLTASQAAARLGVKRETLYAYVSRGMLRSVRAPDGRTSAFAADEVAALAARTRRGGRAGGLELVITTALTRISNDRLAYRGADVAALVPGTRFEAVAEWLWTAAWPSGDVVWPRMPGGPRPPGIDGLRVSVALAGAGDDLRYDLSTAAVAASGRRAIAAMVAGLPGQEGGGDIASRLAVRLGAFGHEAIVNAVLVLLADHELAASTLAARVAASVRADPYSVISTGLGVIVGALHGAASEPVVSLLDDIGSPDRVSSVVGDRLRRHERIPGLGHKVYEAVDPRAEILLSLLRATDLDTGRWAVVEALLALVRERFGLVVNIDFALGAFVWAADLDLQVAETLFAVARSAGWVAHAMEEYGEEPVRFRPRAIYTGAGIETAEEEAGVTSAERPASV